MDFLRKLFKTESPNSLTNVEEPVPSSAEEIIAILRQGPAAAPICWIVCYEDRPLQGAPSDNLTPHLLIFSSTTHAQAFITGRRRFFMPEPLSIEGVDSASRLKQLAATPANDDRYEDPPFGLLLDFAYPTGTTKKTVSPQAIAQMDANQLARALGPSIAELDDMVLSW